MAKKKKNSSRRIFIFIGVLIVLITILGVIAGAMGLFGPSERTTKVEFEKIEMRTVTQVVTASGKVQPEIEVDISPDVPGEIIELPIKEGDHVRKGALLARIRPDFYVAQVEQSEAAVLQSKAGEAQRRADLLNAELEEKRQQKLYKARAISESDYLTASTRYKTAKAALEAAQYAVQISEARLDESKEQLLKTSIYSPIDGTISVLNVELGERVVGTSQFTGTELMRVAILDRMELEVDVNENDVVNVAVGDTASIEIDAYPERKFHGVVTEIANSARIEGAGTQNQVTNFPVKIRILDPHNTDQRSSGTGDVVSNTEVPIESAEILNFRPGMSGTVDVFTQTIDAAIAVPIQAVTVRDFTQLRKDDLIDKDGNAIDQKAARKARRERRDSVETEEEKIPDKEDLRRVVFLMEDGHAHMVEVTTGISDDTHIVILSGVSEGELVITGPYRAISRTLEPGAAVEEDTSERDRTRRS